MASRYGVAFGSEWPGFVVRMSIALISSRASARNISIVFSPGLDWIVPGLLPHNFSICARCSAFFTPRP